MLVVAEVGETLSPNIFDFILGTPKHVPTTKAAPNTPEINGRKTFLPNPFEERTLACLNTFSLLILNSLLHQRQLQLFSTYIIT